MSSPLTTPPTAPPASPEEVPAHFDFAFNRSDVDAVVAVFDDTATMRLTNEQVIEDDHASLRAAFTQQLSQPLHIRNVVRQVIRSGDVALALVDWTITVQSPEGPQQVGQGTATQVMKQQADGSWRLKISNPLGVA